MMEDYELTTVQSKDIIFDISQLFEKEVLSVNATKLAKQFGKDVRDYFKLKSTKEYYQALDEVILNEGNSTHLEFVKTAKGKYGGTYIHSDVLVHFLRWLDIKFAVKCDFFIRHKIQEAHDERVATLATINANKANELWTITREAGKETRNALTDAIKTFCRYAENSREETYSKSRCPYFITLTNLVYGLLKLKKPKGNKPLRDIFSIPIVSEIERIEDKLTALIYEVISKDMEYHKAFQYIKKTLGKDIRYEMGNLV